MYMNYSNSSSVSVLHLNHSFEGEYLNWQMSRILQTGYTFLLVHPIQSNMSLEIPRLPAPISSPINVGHGFNYFDQQYWNNFGLQLMGPLQENAVAPKGQPQKITIYQK